MDPREPGDSERWPASGSDGLSDEHIAAALRGYAAGGSAAGRSAAGGPAGGSSAAEDSAAGDSAAGGRAGAPPAAGARVRQERPRPSAAGLLLYALLLGLLAGACCAAVTLL